MHTRRMHLKDDCNFSFFEYLQRVFLFKFAHLLLNLLQRQTNLCNSELFNFILINYKNNCTFFLSNFGAAVESIKSIKFVTC